MKPVIALMMLAGLLASQLSSGASLSKSDVKYINKSAQDLMCELKFGSLAQERADGQRVNDFGKQIVTDHGKDMEELNASKELETITGHKQKVVALQSQSK